MNRRRQSGKLGSDILRDSANIDLTENQEATFPAFRAFLLEHRTAVGNVLLGDASGPWTKSEMRQFEEMIKHSDLDDSTVIAYLRILYRVSICWIQRHSAELETEVELPRAALLMPEFENPFRMSLAFAFRSHRGWGDWLTAQLRKRAENGHDRSQMSSIVPLLVSAVLYGGIWNEPELAALVRALPTLLSCIMATSKEIYMGLSVSWHGASSTEYRSWQPDALTAMLLMRTPFRLAQDLLQPDQNTPDVPANDSTIVKRIKEQFEAAREKIQGPRLCSFDLLLRSSACIGYTQMPGMVAAYAHRRYMAQSLSLSQMQRISDKKWLFGLPAVKDSTVAADSLIVRDTAELPPTPEWSEEIASALDAEESAEAVARLKRLPAGITLTRLAERIVKYALSVILLAPVAGSRENRKKFSRSTAVLSSFFSAEFGDKDPAEFPSDELESSYVRVIDRAKSIPQGDRIARDLNAALARFHSYMRNCHGKDRLSLKGILVPPVLLDRFDVDLLARDEYLEVRRRIRLRWPGSRNRNRRNIATGIVILGAAGLRREEARLLRILDLQLDGWEGILVQPFEGHSLKSASAERKVPAELIPPDDFEILRNWSEIRPESVKSQNGPLFGCEEFVCVSPGIFRVLNRIISGVTGTNSDPNPTHFHHLRKSLCSYALFRLLLPAGCEPPDYLSEADRSWLIAGPNCRPDKVRRTKQPWNSDVFLVGQYLGHLHGSTTLSRYFHFSGELLRVYLSRSAELSPTQEQLRLVVGNGSESKDKAVDSQSVMELAVSLLGNMARSSRITPVAIPSQTHKQSSSFLTEILAAWDLLSAVEKINPLIEGADAVLDDAAGDLGMDVRRAKAIIDAAESLSSMTSGNGKFRHRFIELPAQDSQPAARSIIPVRSNSPYDAEITKRFADRIEAIRGSKILSDGINAYVRFLWDSEGCPVFTDSRKHGTAAAAYLKLLRKLEICDKDVRFGSYDCKGSVSRTEWRNELKLNGRRHLERWQVPYCSRQSVRPWLGIKPTFGHEAPVKSPGLFGFRFFMVMSYIVLQADNLLSANH